MTGCRQLLFGGSGFNAPGSSRLSKLNGSTVAQWDWAWPDDPRPLCPGRTRELALVEDGDVRHIVIAFLALLDEMLPHCDETPITCPDVTNGHLLGELNSGKGNVTFNGACAWHTARAIVCDFASETTKPTLLKGQGELHRFAIGHVLDRVVAICSTPYPCNFFGSVHAQSGCSGFNY